MAPIAADDLLLVQRDGVPYHMQAQDLYPIIDSHVMGYIEAVEAADGEPLEDSVRVAMNNLILELKRIGGLYDVGIFAGPRTLAGALISPSDPSPAGNFIGTNLVATDYNRKVGLMVPDIKKATSPRYCYFSWARSETGSIAVYAIGGYDPSNCNFWAGTQGSGTYATELGAWGYNGQPWQDSLACKPNIYAQDYMQTVFRPRPPLPAFIASSRLDAATITVLAGDTISLTQPLTSPSTQPYDPTAVGGVAGTTGTGVAYYYLGELADDAAHRNAVETYLAAIAAAIPDPVVSN